MQDIRIKTFIIVALTMTLASGFIPKVTPEYKPTTVFIFLTESCPICQSYTLTLKNLYKKYSDKNVKFIGVFSNYYTNVDSMNAFKEKYDIPFKFIYDFNGLLAKRFKATITPQVFVENYYGKVVYSGRIDDSFYALGKRRTVITSNDLDNALNEIINNQDVKIAKTQAVGCIITSSK